MVKVDFGKGVSGGAVMGNLVEGKTYVTQFPLMVSEKGHNVIESDGEVNNFLELYVKNGENLVWVENLSVEESVSIGKVLKNSRYYTENWEFFIPAGEKSGFS